MYLIEPPLGSKTAIPHHIIYALLIAVYVVVFHVASHIKQRNKNQEKNNEKPKDKIEKTTKSTQPTEKKEKPIPEYHKCPMCGAYLTQKELYGKLRKKCSNTSCDFTESVKIEAYIGETLKEQGYNDYVCAGIMGNLMAEVGGQTLNLDPYLGSYYYGICQWGGGRKSRLLNNYGSSLDAQLEFLAVELPEVISTDSSFYSMQNEQQAALYFAQYYERCSSSTYSIRQQNATVAYNYFVG